MKKIIALASLNMDVVMPVEKLPAQGETIFGGSVSYVPGGKGLNQVVAASRFDARVHAFGHVGNDHFGKTITNFLKKEKIEKLAITKAPRPSGAALIFVSKSGECTIGVGSGVNMEIPASIVQRMHIQNGDVALATLEVPQKAILALFKKAKRTGAHTVLNAAPAVPFISGMLASVDFLILNETELNAFTKKKINPKNIQATIRMVGEYQKKNPHIHLIVTLGAYGLIYAHNGATLFIPAHSVRVADTTGAGDSFVGTFAAALAEGLSVGEALTLSNAAAALKVTRFGASSMPTKKEVARFLKNR